MVRVCVCITLEYVFYTRKINQCTIDVWLFLRFMSSFNRPNLRYSIISKKGKNCSDEVVAMIMTKFKNTCGIVYCLSRKDCDDYTAHMKKNGIKAMSYHAGLTDSQRSNCQGKWISDEVHLLTYTRAHAYAYII